VITPARTALIARAEARFEYARKMLDPEWVDFLDRRVARGRGLDAVDALIDTVRCARLAVEKRDG
jgi:hypothetical protein